MCQQSSLARWATPTQAGGTSLPGVGQGLKALLPGVRPESGRINARINARGEAARGGPLCWAASQSEDTCSFAPTGEGQSDSAQKPELNAIFEGLQAYYLQVRTATLLQGQEEAEQSSVAWGILEVLW